MMTETPKLNPENAKNARELALINALYFLGIQKADKFAQSIREFESYKTTSYETLKQTLTEYHDNLVRVFQNQTKQEEQMICQIRIIVIFALVYLHLEDIYRYFDAVEDAISYAQQIGLNGVAEILKTAL